MKTLAMLFPVTAFFFACEKTECLQEYSEKPLPPPCYAVTDSFISEATFDMEVMELYLHGEQGRQILFPGDSATDGTCARFMKLNIEFNGLCAPYVYLVAYPFEDSCIATTYQMIVRTIGPCRLHIDPNEKILTGTQQIYFNSLLGIFHVERTIINKEIVYTLTKEGSEQKTSIVLRVIG